MEAYSRVLGNLAFSILSRIGDVMKEDIGASNPNSPASTSCCFTTGILLNITNNYSPIRSLDDADGRQHYASTSSTAASISNGSSSSSTFDSEINSYSDAKASPVVSSTPSRRRVWCIGREACVSVSPPNSP